MSGATRKIHQTPAGTPAHLDKSNKKDLKLFMAQYNKDIILVKRVHLVIFAMYTFIRATLDFIFFFSSFGLSLFPHALVTCVIDFKVVRDFFFFSFSLSFS